MFLVRKQNTQRSEGDELDMSKNLGTVVIGQRETQEQRPEYFALFLFLQKIKIKTDCDRRKDSIHRVTEVVVGGTGISTLVCRKMWEV